MARPKSNETEKLSARIIFRLTAEEFAALQTYSGICGKTVSAIIRAKLTTGKFPQPKRPRLDLQTYAELKKIGVNINQLTRSVNGGRPGMPMDFYQMYMKQSQQLDLIGRPVRPWVTIA